MVMVSGIDQAGAELREVENADHQCHQPGKVERDDAPRQAGEGQRDEELPRAAQQAGEAAATAQLVGMRGCAVRTVAFDGRRGVFRGSVEHGFQSAGCDRWPGPGGRHSTAKPEFRSDPGRRKDAAPLRFP
jgi:hypothetical protein